MAFIVETHLDFITQESTVALRFHYLISFLLILLNYYILLYSILESLLTLCRRLTIQSIKMRKDKRGFIKRSYQDKLTRVKRYPLVFCFLFIINKNYVDSSLRMCNSYFGRMEGIDSGEAR